MIAEKLPQGARISTDAKNLIINLCMDFLTQVAASSNEECSKKGKKTIFPEHVIDALDVSSRLFLLANPFSLVQTMKLHEFLIKIA